MIAADRYDDIFATPIEDVALPNVDIVIAADVLEHLEDPWAALAKLRAATVNGGLLFVSVPNAQFIKAIVTVARGRFPYEDGGYWDRTHLRWFTGRSLAGVLEETGWRADKFGFAAGEGRRGRAVKLAPWTGPLLGHQLHVAATAS